MKKKPTKTPNVKELRSQSISIEPSYTEGIPFTDDFFDLDRSYNVHVWVYAACWAIASNLAGLEVKGYRKGNKGLWTPFENHPWLPVLQRPNPYMSGYLLRELTFLGLELSGNAYWAIERDKDTNEVFELWPLPSSQVRAVATKQRLIDHYIFRVNGIDVTYAYDEIVHFKYANPNSFIYGQGSLQAAKMAVASDIYAKVWNKTFFQNAARPDAVFEVDNTLSEDVRKRVMAQWNAMHRASDKRGKTAILEGGMKYKETNRTPKDLDFVELQKLSREEILAAFGVPPIMCGILEYANFASSKEQTAIFWKHTLMPKKRSFDSVLTMRAQQISFDSQTVFEADVTGVEALRIDEMQRSRTSLNYYNIGVPLNSIIKAFDLPFDPVPGGDVPKFVGSAGTGGGGLGGGGTGDGGGKALPAPKPEPKNTKAIADKTAHWKAFDRKISGREDDMAMAMRAFFRGQRGRVLKAFEEHAGRLLAPHLGKAFTPQLPAKIAPKPPKPLIDIHLIFDDKKENNAFRSAADPFISSAYYDFAIAAGRAEDANFNFQLGNPAAQHWIDSKQVKLVQEANSYTKEEITDSIVDGVQDALSEGLATGDAIKTIASRIDDFYSFAVDSRSTRIARTEIIGASNAGTYEGMKQAGVENKEWLATKDDKTRETHQDLDGTVVPMDDSFISSDGSKLDFPGDPEADPSEIINCRCTLISARGDQ